MKKIIPFLLLLLCLAGCSSAEERAYYADESNYITAVGTVCHIKYTDDGEELYLGLSGLGSEFADVNFRIIGASLTAAQGRGIDGKLQIGDEVTFISAPSYFGDGYVVPIAALTVHGETLVEFDEGFESIRQWMAEK